MFSFVSKDRPAAVELEPSSGNYRLDSQIKWYDSKSLACQRKYKSTKVIELLAAASIPIASSTAYPISASVLGVIVVVCEGLQQLNQWHSNWNNYRSTCEELRHEKFSFLAEAGPYRELDRDEAARVLSERIETLVSTEHTNWFGNQERARKASPRKEEARPARPKSREKVTAG